MKVEGTYAFAAPRETVFRMLLDPEVVALTIPGTSGMHLVAHQKYEGVMRLGLGPITAAEFDLSVTLAEVVAPERYTMLIDGRGKLGFARGSALVRLAPDAAGTGTQMHYGADLQVGGAVAAAGQRLLDSVGRMMMRQALGALAQEINRRLGQGPAPGGRSSVPDAPGIPRLDP